MRKIQKKQISEQLSILYEACEELQKQSGETFVDLCADIQDFVSRIYELVENVAGEGTKTASLLNEFYEMLFKATQGEVTAKQLLSFAGKMNASIYEIKADKMEIAFFCYKASMSDCLASIYFAAKEDPACDAYFIPIPYYDRTADGSFGPMHLESEGYYSDRFELTDWRAYKIEERLPDIIFFMNPYDQHNFVTSVHSDFYSRRLKQFCDMLCYSPYFVSDDNIDFVKNGNETLCVTTGAMNADCIFVQSEKVKKAWIAAIHKFEQESNCEGAFGDLEKKIVALGSPKFDAVVNTRREDCPLPEALAKLINGRKVVLYNTTISAILNDGERHLKKIRSVLEVFKKRRDVVLWWRPHPLSEQTYASMQPDMLDDYRAIIADYRRDGYGIYDDPQSMAKNFLLDTISDLHRAIAWSDAYYGNGSSVDMLFRAAGKPVLFQNVGSSGNSESASNPHIRATYFDDRYIYYSEIEFNAFCRINRITKEVEFLRQFPAENKPLLYGTSIRVKNRLYFSPLCAAEIAVFDLDKGEFCDSIRVKSIEDSWNCGKLRYTKGELGYGGFCCTLNFGDSIYFIPYKYPAIVCLNTQNNEIEYYDDFLEQLSKHINSNTAMFGKQCVINETTFLLPTLCGNAVLEFDTVTNTSNIHSVGKSTYSYGSIIYDGENCWLAPATFETPIVKWNPSEGVLLEIDNYPAEKVEPWMPFHEIALIDRNLYFFSDNTNPPFKLNIDSHSVSPLEYFHDKYCEVNGCKNYFSYFGVDRNKLYLYQTLTGKMLVCDFRTENIEEFSLEMPDKVKSLYKTGQANRVFGTFHAMSETETVTLDRFLDYLVQDNQFGIAAVNGRNIREGNAGKNIYEFIKHNVIN